VFGLTIPLTALVVDDDPGVRSVVGTVLATTGIRSLPATSGQEALRILEADRVDFGILDLHVRAESGVALIAQLRRRRAGFPVILMSGAFDARTREEARALGVHSCLDKPLDLAGVRRAIEGLATAEGWIRRLLRAERRRSRGVPPQDGRS
jgi:DNA-binding response OmpR family regulator